MTAAVVTPVANDQNYGIANFASMSFTTDGGTPAAYVVPVGFQPRYVKVFVSGTNPNTYEWFDGMANPYSLITTGSTGVTTEGTDITVLGPENTDFGTAAAPLNAAVPLVDDPGLNVAGNSVGGLHTNVQGGFIGYGVSLDSTIMAASSTVCVVIFG